MSRHAKSATPAAGRRANSWEAPIEKWVGRILGKDWEVQVIPTEELKGTLWGASTMQDHYPYRHAIIEYNPDAPPTDYMACHEVVHIALAPLAMACKRASGVIGAAGKVLAEWTEDAEERTCDVLTRALLRAHGEE